MHYSVQGGLPRTKIILTVPSVFAWRPQSSESGGEQKMSRYERLAKRQRLAVDEGSDHETDWECVQ